MLKNSKILTYSAEQMRQLAKLAHESYMKNLTQMLTFEDWKCNAMQTLHDNPAEFNVKLVDYSEPIRIAPDTYTMLDAYKAHESEFSDITMNAPAEQQDYLITQLCKKIWQPKMVINRPQGFTLPGKVRRGGSTEEVQTPIWFNSSLKGVNIRLGYANMDSATPGALRLDDVCVHSMVGGTSGSGKSVAINTLACTLFCEYAPWELNVYMLDLKVVELIRYANRVKSPHVLMVGASGSTEFTLSLLSTLREEMNARAKVFAICGVQNIKDFREKFGMVMPRTVLLVDEFVQLFEYLKDAEQAGCTDVDEQKTAINSAISAIARLGRSMGIHMLLSSQSLDGALDDQTINQFKGGVTLNASASVSTALIGNDAGVRIVGKGKCIVTSDKLAKDEALNVYTRVPYIEDKVSEEEAAAGKLPYLQQFLLSLRKLADEIGWDNELYSYDENAKIPYQQFNLDLEYGAQREATPRQDTPVSDEIFRDEITKCIVLGKPVMYTRNPAATLDLKTRMGNSIVVGATNIQDREYILKLLIENLKSPRFGHYVITADRAITDLSRIAQIIPEAQIIRAKQFPMDLYAKMLTRKRILGIYTVLQDVSNGKWDTAATVNTILSTVQFRFLDCDKQAAIKVADMLLSLSEEQQLTYDLDAGLREAGADETGDLGGISQVVMDTVEAFGVISEYTQGFTREFKVSDLEKGFVWFMGLDDMTDSADYAYKDYYKSLINEGPIYGIHSIITAAHWEKVGALVESTEFILECCQKQFFMDCGLPVHVNINPGSFQMINRQSKQYTILRKYQIT